MNFWAIKAKPANTLPNLGNKLKITKVFVKKTCACAFKPDGGQVTRDVFIEAAELLYPTVARAAQKLNKLTRILIE